MVKDIFLNKKQFVNEKLATKLAKKDDVMFCRILCLDNISIFVGSFPYPIPAYKYKELMDIREFLCCSVQKRTMDHLTLDDIKNLQRNILFEAFILLEDFSNTSFQKPINADGNKIVLDESDNDYTDDYTKLKAALSMK